ncbi:MAG: hypothetical protein ACREID_05385, partial [Planctomycetota bacterium]
VQMAVGFLDTFLAEFLKEAELTEQQTRAIQALYEQNVRDALQVIADVTNGDLSPDQAYQMFEAMIGAGQTALRAHLDGTQYDVYGKLEKNVKEYIVTNVVSTEMASLRDELRLDGEQQKRVQELIRERYDRVQAKLSSSIPNIFFRPIRRESDRDIYEETARRIKELLRPEQGEAFDRYEQAAAGAYYTNRLLLVPK